MRRQGNALPAVLPSLLFLAIAFGGSIARGDEAAEPGEGAGVPLRTHVPVRQYPAAMELEDAEPGEAWPGGMASSAGPSGAGAQLPTPAPTAPEHRLRVPFQLSAYAQVQSGTSDALKLRRARVRAIGRIGTMWTYRLEGEFANAPFLLDAEARLGLRTYLNITAGQFKVPFSQESQWMDAALPMVDRAQVVNKLAPGRDNGSNGRDIGVEASGSFPLRGKTGMEYSLGVFNGRGINTTAGNSRKDMASRLAVRPVERLTFAGDYYHGHLDGTDRPRDRADAEYRYDGRQLLLMGEFIRAKDDTLHRQGWYALEGWKFSPKWQGLFRVDAYIADRSAKNDTTTIYLGGVNWAMNKHLRFQLNGGYQDKKSAWSPDVVSQVQVSF